MNRKQDILHAVFSHREEQLLAQALEFVEKAIALDSRHVLEFQLRGELLLKLGKAEHAIVAYFQANNNAKDLASYRTE